VPLQKAVEEGALPHELGEHLRRVDKMTFAEAVGKGLIDVAEDRFREPESGRQMSIAEAVQQGLIDTGAVKGGVGDEPADSRNLARVLNSEEFDERSGRVQVRPWPDLPPQSPLSQDPQTRLYLPFGTAVNQRMVDADSLLHDLDSSKTMTLREAMTLGLIDAHVGIPAFFN
jgi:hypothetical protein